MQLFSFDPRFRFHLRVQVLYVIYLGNFAVLRSQCLETYFRATGTYRDVGTGPPIFVIYVHQHYSKQRGRLGLPHRFDPFKIFDIPSALNLILCVLKGISHKSSQKVKNNKLSANHYF